MNSRPDFYNPIYYSVIKRPFIRHSFPGLESIQINHSQLHQDIFVLCMLAGKRGGTYLEIGAHEPIFISNTYLLEQGFGWRGVGLELDREMVERHWQLRRNPCLHANALQVDYEHLIAEFSLPPVIDYLSVDIDPPANSLAALKRLPHHSHRFRVITFEHDLSNGGAAERLESRRFLRDLGYQLLVNDVSWCSHIVEDWWVEPSLVETSSIEAMKAEKQDYHPHDQYFYQSRQHMQELTATLEPVSTEASINDPDGLCVEGWRDLNHSYSLVNQWQLLQMLQHPFRLRHRDVEPFIAGWNRISNSSGLANDKRQRIQAIPSPDPADRFKVIYRIAYPYNISDGQAERIFVFGTTEYTVLPEQFIGGSLDVALKRGNLEFITPSQWSKQGFMRAGIGEELIHVIPHGVESSDFFRVEPELREFYRQLFGFSPDDVVLLNLGSLTYNKGVDLLLQAYAALKPRYSHLKLVIKDQSNLYGRRLDTVLREMAASGQPLALSDEQLADVIQISENLDIDGLRALYNASDLYVSPYRAEGFNLPPLEAAACGLPVLVTAGGSTDDYFDPALGLQIPSELIKGEQGMVSLEPDLDGLIHSLERYLAQERAMGGSEGSALVHERFSWQRIGDQLVRRLGLA